MTPSVLLGNLGVSVCALAALCLSLDRHHLDALGRRAGLGRRRWLRAFGWSGVLLSLLVAGRYEGWAFGPVQWLGALTAAGLALALLAAYRPRLVGWIGLAALLGAGVSLILSA